MQSNFEQALERVFAHEGGYVNLKTDPGGATNRGVTQRTYDAWRQRIGERPRDVRELSDDEARRIYKEQYADKVWFDRLPAGLDYALFDFAVNSGVARAVKCVQRIVGVREDGIMGVQTLAAVQAKAPKALVADLCAARLKFVRGLKGYKHFGRGWSRRIADVQQRALLLAGSAPLLPPDYATDGVEATPKADGAQSLVGSIAASRRSKAAVAGCVGAALSAVPEAVELAKPAKEAFAFGQYAAVLGAAITALALGYIVWVRSRDVRD